MTSAVVLEGFLVVALARAAILLDVTQVDDGLIAARIHRHLVELVRGTLERLAEQLIHL